MKKQTEDFTSRRRAGEALIYYAGLFVIFFLPLMMVNSEAEEVVLWESFELIPSWFAVKDAWNDNDSSLEAGQSIEHPTEGNYSLKCVFKMNGKNGASYANENLGAYTNWENVTGILVDFFNATNKKFDVALALCTGSAWTWQETKVITLNAGENRNLKFSLFNNTLKSAATGWQNTASLKMAEDVRRVIFKFFGSAGLEGSVYIDNIRFLKNQVK